MNGKEAHIRKMNMRRAAEERRQDSLGYVAVKPLPKRYVAEILDDYGNVVAWATSVISQEDADQKALEQKALEEIE
jgi:hypothetical protein